MSHIRLCWAGAALSLASVAAHAADGDFDASWGIGGHLQVDVTSPGSDLSKTLLIQSDGKLLMAGACTADTGHPSFCATRQLPNGSYDTSFGPISHPGRVVYSDTGLSVVDSVLNAAALTPDGGSLLVGTFLGSPNYGEYFKLDATGGVSSHGYTSFDSSGDSSIEAIAVQADGKIILVGRTVTASNVHYIAVSRFPAASFFETGTPDTTFGNNGTKLVTFSGGSADFPTAVAIQPDGKVVIVGSSGNKVGVLRLLANGQLDDDPVLGFGDAGRAVFDWGSPSLANAITIDRDGTLLVAGYGYGNMGPGSGSDFFVNRLTPRGGQNPNFAVPCFPFCVAQPAYIAFNLGGSNDDVGRALAVQSDGKILVSGLLSGTAGAGYFGVARLTRDGYPDLSFGSGGQIHGMYGASAGNDAASAIAIGNGSIMLAGYSLEAAGTDYRFGIAKLRLDLIFSNGLE